MRLTRRFTVGANPVSDAGDDRRDLVEQLAMTGSIFGALERPTSLPMEQILMMGLNYTPNPALGWACHAQRKSFDLALERAGFNETRRAFIARSLKSGRGVKQPSSAATSLATRLIGAGGSTA